MKPIRKNIEDYYLVEIGKAFVDRKQRTIIFKLADNSGMFKFPIAKNNLVRVKSPLGSFLHLKEDTYLRPFAIKNVVSTMDTIDTYLVPVSVSYYHNNNIGGK